MLFDQRLDPAFIFRIQVGVKEQDGHSLGLFFLQLFNQSKNLLVA